MITKMDLLKHALKWRNLLIAGVIGAIYFTYNLLLSSQSPTLHHQSTVQVATVTPQPRNPATATAYSQRKQVLVFVHTRKCAGTTLINLFQHNNHYVYLSIDQWKIDPTQPNETDAVFETIQEFDTFDLKQPCDRCYITIGREPIARVISLYHWRLKRRQIPQSTSLSSYLGNKKARSIQRDDMYHGFYSWMQQWCGKEHACTRFASGGDWVLARAKANVEKYCGLIGTTERFKDFIKAGVKIFPQYFGKGDYVTNNANKNSRKSASEVEERRIALASYPPKLLHLERKFYEWMVERAERLHSHLWKEDLPVGTWTPRKMFYQKGGEEIPWKKRGGYKPASFSSPNDPKKTPDLW